MYFQMGQPEDPTPLRSKQDGQRSYRLPAKSVSSRHCDFVILGCEHLVHRHGSKQTMRLPWADIVIGDRGLSSLVRDIFFFSTFCSIGAFLLVETAR